VPSIECREIYFSYRRSDPVLKGVSLSASPGEMLGIVGPNGAGKSTLIRIMAGLLKPQNGSVLLEGLMLHGLASDDRARRIAYVPQDYHLVFPFTVMDVVLSGRYAHGALKIFETREDRVIAGRVLKWTGLENLADRKFEDLSGGERQRAVLAAALAQEPELMLLDEPTSSLDVNHADNLMALLDRLCSDQGLTVIMAVHDLSLASAWCNRLGFLDQGRMNALGEPARVLSFDRLKSVYGDSVKRLDLDGRIVIAPRGKRNTNA